MSESRWRWHWGWLKWLSFFAGILVVNVIIVLSNPRVGGLLEIFAVLSSFIAIIGLPTTLVLWLMDGIGSRTDDRARKRSPELYPGTPEFNARLREPDRAMLASRLPENVVPLLVAFYADESLHAAVAEDGCRFLPDDAEVGDCGATLVRLIPADAISTAHYDRFLPPGSVAVASDDFGDPYFVRPDGSVWQHQHDGDELFEVALTLSEFLNWRRASYFDCCVQCGYQLLDEQLVCPECGANRRAAM